MHQDPELMVSQTFMKLWVKGSLGVKEGCMRFKTDEEEHEESEEGCDK